MNFENLNKKPLNLQMLNNLLQIEITPAQLAGVLDEIIHDYIYSYGLDTDCNIAPSIFANQIFELKRLRNYLFYTALKNGEKLDYTDFISQCEKRYN